MRGARRAQQATVRLKVEVELDGVHDVAIDDRARWAVSALVACSVSGEEADMVTLSDDDDSDGGSNAKLLACLCRNCTWLVDRRVWPPVAHTLDTRKLCKKKKTLLVSRPWRSCGTGRRTDVEDLLELSLGYAVWTE